jgi:hypothetical protein
MGRLHRILYTCDACLSEIVGVVAGSGGAIDDALVGGWVCVVESG